MPAFSGLGCDIIEVSRIELAIQRHGQLFLDRLFTLKEQHYCKSHRDSTRRFAGRFAAKEAIVKALGTGFDKRVSWLDIEIINDTAGKPYPLFSERFHQNFSYPVIQITLSHCKEYAMAVATLTASC